MSHKRFVEPDYVPHSHSKDAHSKAVPHTKYSKDKVNQSKKSNVGEKPVSEKIPYADNDVKKTHPFLCSQGQQRTLVTSESDSDDDICVENELYEPFESAKV
ncbi:hypothetical protein DPMN_058771 [Dreissena polymorpha]|uniref:Uncharacterized protein n=1 Tax=Dreissena polymorpha TaxID=45954 RepID=A0A9D4C2P9_DREPO|nr:hypothetical protein DPMN_058771 [Dreissena polymorpha]